MYFCGIKRDPDVTRKSGSRPIVGLFSHFQILCLPCLLINLLSERIRVIL